MIGHQAVLIKLSNGRYCVLERFADRESRSGFMKSVDSSAGVVKSSVPAGENEIKQHGLQIRDTSTLLEFSKWICGETMICSKRITLGQCREVAEAIVPDYSPIVDNCYMVA